MGQREQENEDKGEREGGRGGRMRRGRERERHIEGEALMLASIKDDGLVFSVIQE